jgi:hypothetical protein
MYWRSRALSEDPSPSERRADNLEPTAGQVWQVAPLKMRAMNQKVFTQMADGNELKSGQVGGGVEGMATCEAMEEIWREIWSSIPEFCRR